MATTTAIARLQQVWDCRWSRPGHRLTGVSDAVQPESAWVCVHDGIRRNISEAECRTCPQWEPIPGAETGAHLAGYAGIATEARRRIITRSIRVVLVCIAVLFIASGFVTLTAPSAVPFTVALWLCAAAFVGFAVFGPFDSQSSAN